MRKLFVSFLMVIFMASVSMAANPKGWVDIKRGKGIKVPASGVFFTENADAPTHGDLADGVVYFDTDDNLYVRAGGAWVDLTVQAGGSLTLDGAFDNGKIINGANSDANAVQIGDGTDAILLHTEGAGDVRITTNGTSDLTIIPDGGDTDITGTLDVSGAVTTAALTAGGTFTVSSGGVTVTSGGIDVDAGGIAVAGGLTVEDTGLTVSAGGINVTGGVTADAATITGNITTSTGDLVASAGELDISGGASNEDLADFTRSNTASGGDGIDLNMGSAVIAGDAIDVSWAGAGTGNGAELNMTNNLAGNAVNITGAGVRTAPIINIANAGTDGGTDDDVIRIVQSGSLDSDIVNLAFGTANSPGNAISIDMDTNLAGEGVFIDEGAGARTGSAFEVTADGTGTHSVIDLNLSGNAAITGLDITGSFNGSPAGDLVKLTLDDGDNLTTGLLNLSVGTGNRNSLIKYTSTGTDSGTTSHVIDINQTGVLDSNILDITYDTGASTGKAISVVMGTNITGRGLFVSSVTGIGLNDTGHLATFSAGGDLASGASAVRIASSGDMASGTCASLEIVETGSAQANSAALTIESTNNYAIEISDGDSIIVGRSKLFVGDAAIGIYSQADTFIDIFADGALRIGDSIAGAPTNYANFGSDGSLTLVGTARETKTIWIPAQAFQNVSGAAQGLVGIAGVWQLSDAASDSLTSTFYIPNGYVEGTNMTVKIHWSSAQITNTATFDGAWLPVVAGEDTSAAGNLFTQEDDAASGTADYLNITEGFAITNGTIDKGDQVILNILRLGSDGNDDLTDDVDFQGVAITYTADRL